MHISWLGHAAFKITTKDTTIAIDPFDGIGLRMSSFNANLLLMTNASKEHSNQKAIRGKPFVVTGPGEYEVHGVFVYGVAEDNRQKDPMTLYMLEVDGVKVAHLGAIKQTNLKENQLDIISDVDVLLIPVGNPDSLTPEQAAKLIAQIEPRIVVPMSYKVTGLKKKSGTLDAFLNEMGVTKPQKIDKLKITQKDLPQEETQFIILNKA